MKKGAFILLLLVSLKSFSQKAADSLHYYIVLYTVGESWDTTKAYHEQKYFTEHSAYLSKMRKNKVISVGARYSDTGMIVINARNEKEAWELVYADTAIQNKLFKVRLFPFEPFYNGCIK